MIELLGVGLDGAPGEWLMRRVSARFENGELTFVVSADRDARLALLDVLRARRIATEGRAWLDGRPVTPQTATKIAARIGNVHLHAHVPAKQSVLSTVLPPEGWARRALRTAFGGRRSEARELTLRTLHTVGLNACAHEPVAQLDAWRRRRLAVARAMIPRPDHLVVREIDDALSSAEAADVLGVLRTLARSERMPVVVSAADPMLLYLFADHVLMLSGGTVTFEGTAGLAASAWHPSRELALT
jgi:ABC-type cobalamin/Fe3+-siderophores transport system ATPase subunit